jgi:RNA polymerase I-specific transcription initiation factor RRN3
MGQSQLLQIIILLYPHKKYSCYTQVVYVTQLLRICGYQPSIQAKILELIIRKCLEMDVDIVVEDNGEVCLQESVNVAEDDNLFDFDEDDLNKHSKADANRTNTDGSSTQHRLLPQSVTELAEKLDASLSLLCNFCESQVTAASRGQSQQGGATLAEKLFSQLLVIFESVIFPTYKSKFSQFVIFYVASRNVQFAVQVANLMFVSAMNEGLSMLKRQCAVMYMASYMARATFLPLSVVW